MSGMERGEKSLAPRSTLYVMPPPTSITALRALLNAHGVRPKKSLGQNFLVNENLLHAIVRAADAQSSDWIIEVGPGVGTLTQPLALAAQHVVAVELDQNMVAILRETLADYQNVTIIHDDILKVDITKVLSSEFRVPSSKVQVSERESNPQFPTPNLQLPITNYQLPPYKVVANLPYYITSAVLRKFLDSAHKPTLLVLMTQREVAQRIMASPGDLSLLAVSVQFYAQPSLVLKLPAGAFYPAPQVDSAVIKLEVRASIPEVEVEKFFRVAQAGFSQKRKQLRNSLAAGLNITTEESEALLQRAGIDAQRRAQTLTIEEWVRLANSVWRMADGE
jgi:16S rRNA (adenine1518-N6/adenine1519-N6)-dimethyltransferase